MMNIVNATEQYMDGLLTIEEWKQQVAFATSQLSDVEALAFVNHLRTYLNVDGTFAG